MDNDEELRLTSLCITPSENKATFFLDGDNRIRTKQFPGLKRLMESGGYTHLSGSTEKGWTVSKPDAKLRQSESDAILPQLKDN
jgi:hypothetical protein